MSRRALAERILAYLDGETDADAERALAADIAVDPQARRLLARMMRIHGNVGNTLREQASAVRVPEPAPHRPIRHRARVVVLGGVVALAAAASVALWAWPGPAPGPLSIAHRTDGKRTLVTAERGPAVPVPSVPGLVQPPAPGLVADASRLEVLERYDFEDGRRPPHWRVSPVRRCPPRPGNRYCLQVTRFRSDQPRSIGVDMGQGRTIFTYADDLVLRFDYWMGAWVPPRPAYLRVFIHDADQDAPFYLPINDATPGRWVTVTASLRDFIAERPSNAGQRMRPGDRIDFLVIAATLGDQDLMFIDNVELARQRP